jgi:uncharacterized protein YprB with RNaseH-like and TPR domain
MNPAILFLDIETSPDLVWTWGVYEQNAIAVKEHWQVLTYGAKWFGKSKVIVRGQDDTRGYKPGKLDDAAILVEVHALLDEADVVVAHNGTDFDIKKLNARFIYQRMTPPSPFRVVDTKRETKKVAAFSSNKLDWLCQQLEIGKKLEHEGWPMWKGCIEGDPKMWAKMKKYNAHDVDLLEQLYRGLSPWYKQSVNANLWAKGVVCPNPACGSSRLQARGVARNRTRAYRRFQCLDCGAWGRQTVDPTHRAKVVGV